METSSSQAARELPPSFRLAHGRHTSFKDGACLMEAVAYIAGEAHSDHPRCACPVLTRHGIRLNDRFSDEERQLLAPLIPWLVNTRADRATQLRRVHVLIDASIHETTPMAYDAIGWADLATRLREIDLIMDEASARVAREVVLEVRDEAAKRKRSDAYASYATYATAYTAAAAYDYAYAYAYAYVAAKRKRSDDDAAASAYAYAAAAAAAAAYAAAIGAAEKLSARRKLVEATIASFARAIQIR